MYTMDSMATLPLPLATWCGYTLKQHDFAGRHNRGFPKLNLSLIELIELVLMTLGIVNIH